MTTETPKIQFEYYKGHHYPGFKSLMEVCFSDLENPSHSEQEVAHLAALYPKGQIVCIMDEKIVGAVISRVVPFERYRQAHTQHDCMNTLNFNREFEEGDALYGLDIFVDPAYQMHKIGKQLVGRMVQNGFDDNFRCMMGICRVVDYPKYMHEMDCETYALKVVRGELVDNSLSFHVRNGMQYVNVSPNFNPEDYASAGYGVIMQLPNPNYNALLPIFPERAHVLRKIRQEWAAVSVA